MEWPIAINDIKKELEKLRELISSGSGLPEVYLDTRPEEHNGVLLTPAEEAALIAAIPSPCIIHWNDNESVDGRAAVFSLRNMSESIIYEYVDVSNIHTQITINTVEGGASIIQYYPPD